MVNQPKHPFHQPADRTLLQLVRVMGKKKAVAYAREMRQKKMTRTGLGGVVRRPQL